MDERALMGRARSGDRSAFGALIQRHADRVLAVALRILGNREDAEDAVQSAIAKVLERLAGFRGDAAFGTWFMSIAVRTCIDRDRRRRARPTLVPLERAEPAVARGDAGALRRLLHQETAAAVERELERLPVRIRSALVLRAVDGMAYPQLADTLGITVRTARMYVFEARQRLSRSLGPWLDDREDPA